MRHKNNQSGFSAVEAILILVVIGIIGFAGWFVYNSQKSTKQTLSDANTSESAATTKKDIKTPQKAEVLSETYMNDEFGFSFQYPKSWKFASQLSNIGRGNNEGTVSVTSPYGTVVNFNPNLGGKGGDCYDDTANGYTTKTCSTRTVLSVEKLSTSSASDPIYFYHMSLTPSTDAGSQTVFYEEIRNGDISPTKTGSTVGAFLHPYDEIKSKVGYVTVSVKGPDQSKNVSAEYFTTQEAKEAEPILKSFKLL